MLRPSIFRNNFAEDIFDDFFTDPFKHYGIRTASAMKADIKEHDDAYQIDMELPGFPKEDIKVELKDGYLTVQAAHTEEKEEKEKKSSYIRKERYSGHYQRSFYVGDDITDADISAKFKDGVLTLQIPKKEKQQEVEEAKYIAIDGE